MTSHHSLISTLAPTGKLRVSINLGNPLLASRNHATGMPEGISVDMAGLFAQRLGVEIDWVLVDTARASVEMVETQQADIGFFAIDPARAAHISFTAAYVLIEGAYAVKADSPIKANHQVDREGCQVVVGKGSAYDLFLTRELRSAKITRAPNSSSVVDTFLHQRADVAAGIRQQLEEEAKRIPGLRILAEPFMLIAQALGSHKGRGNAVQEHLSRFVEETKSSGFISAALIRHGIHGATVAAAA
jgi:polar amino acid transport system substrate-binding protein